MKNDLNLIPLSLRPNLITARYFISFIFNHIKLCEMSLQYYQLVEI